MLKVTYMFVTKYLQYAISSRNHVSKMNIYYINELLDNIRYPRYCLLGLSEERPMTLLFSICHLLKTTDRDSHKKCKFSQLILNASNEDANQVPGREK